MVPLQRLHQLVLQAVDVLEFVDHDVFQALLPLEPDVFVLPEDVQRKDDEVVVVQSEALLRLVQVAVEDDVLYVLRRHVFVVQRVQRQRDDVQIVVRLFKELLDLDHVPGVAETHVSEGQPPLLVDDLQHGIDVGVVQHQEALRVLHCVALLVQHRHAKAVERVDVARVVVAGHPVDALAHLLSRLVRERDAQDVAGHDAQLVDQIRKTASERPGLARARSRDDPHIPFRGRNCLPLRFIQLL